MVGHMQNELNSDVQKESITSPLVTAIGENLDEYMIQPYILFYYVLIPYNNL